MRLGSPSNQRGRCAQATPYVAVNLQGTSSSTIGSDRVVDLDRWSPADRRAPGTESQPSGGPGGQGSSHGGPGQSLSDMREATRVPPCQRMGGWQAWRYSVFGVGSVSS